MGNGKSSLKGLGPTGGSVRGRSAPARGGGGEQGRVGQPSRATIVRQSWAGSVTTKQDVNVTPVDNNRSSATAAAAAAAAATASQSPDAAPAAASSFGFDAGGAWESTTPVPLRPTLWPGATTTEGASPDTAGDLGLLLFGPRGDKDTATGSPIRHGSGRVATAPGGRHDNTAVRAWRPIHRSLKLILSCCTFSFTCLWVKVRNTK